MEAQGKAEGGISVLTERPPDPDLLRQVIEVGALVRASAQRGTGRAVDCLCSSLRSFPPTADSPSTLALPRMHLLTPNHIQLVSACYPSSSALLTAGPDYSPNSQELSRLTYYAANRPGKINKLGNELEKRVKADSRKAAAGNAKARACVTSRSRLASSPKQVGL